MSQTVDEWMNAVSGDGWQWYVKYLAGNDTLLTKAHQAGPYIPKPFAFDVFPSIHKPDKENPRATVKALIESHGDERTPSMIWYNTKTRNECHFTGWGGQQSKLLDPENTGALTVFAFYRKQNHDAELCRIWIARDTDEEEAILARVGPVEPGRGIIYQAGIHVLKDHHQLPKDAPCSLGKDEIPKDWLFNWPAASEIVKLSIEKLPSTKQNPPDQRLLRRHDCEYEIFQSIERVVLLPRVKEAFETVQLFVDFANTVLNRRKARAGSSLELQTKAVFDEENLPYSHTEESEEGKKPDFLFPSAVAYQDANVPVKNLRMLAVKTTCKDRWRQVIDEAKRLPTKHLLTIQQGVSPKQYAQMKKAGIVLVVPKPIHKTFREELRTELLTLEQFIASTKATCKNVALVK